MICLNFVLFDTYWPGYGSQGSNRVFFPDYNYLCSAIVRDPLWDGTCTEPVTYHDVLAAWKNICMTVLEREGLLGAHSGRKTGYLFGVWDGGQNSDLRMP
jgi:hypothetical protein